MLKIREAESVRLLNNLTKELYEVESYTLEIGELVIYDPELKAYVDSQYNIYEPVGEPIEGFRVVGECLPPATTEDEDVFFLVEKALENSRKI